MDYNLIAWIKSKAASIRFTDQETEEVIKKYAEIIPENQKLSFKDFFFRLLRGASGIIPEESTREDLPAKITLTPEAEAAILNYPETLEKLMEAKNSIRELEDKLSKMADSGEGDPVLSEMKPYTIVARERTKGQISTNSDLFAAMLKLCQQRGAFILDRDDVKILEQHGL